MPNIAILGSTISGMTSGEHHGHASEASHGACALSGTVTQGSSKIRINGVGVALANYPTSENDCCGPGIGMLGAIAHKIRVQGKSVQFVGDATIPHNGTATITSGSSKIRSI